MGNRHRLSNANFEADIGFSVCWKIKTLIRSDLKKIVQCKASDAQKKHRSLQIFQNQEINNLWLLLLWTGPFFRVTKVRTDFTKCVKC